MITINCDKCKKQQTHYVEIRVGYDSNTVGQTPEFVNITWQLCKVCFKELEGFINIG